MKTLILILAALAVAGPAHASFRVGIVDPAPVPSSDSAELGSSIQRYDLVWPGSTDLDLAEGTTPVLMVAPGKSYASVYPQTASEQLAFCVWVGEILERYPQIKAVVFGNEPRIPTWPDYVATLRVCSTVVHAHGAAVAGPGAYPVSDPNELVPLMRSLGGLLDVWDQRVYWTDIGEIVQLVDATLGIPVWVTEDGVQSKPPLEFASLYSGSPDAMWDGGLAESAQASGVSTQMLKTYCAGAEVWMNFLLRDEADLGRWQSGLERPDGSLKPAYAAFRATRTAISSGDVECASKGGDHPKLRLRYQDIADKLGEIGLWARDAYINE